MRYTIEIDDRLVPVDVRALGAGRYQIQFEGQPTRTVDASVSGDLVHLLNGLDSFSVVVGKNGDERQAHTRGATARLSVLDGRTARRRARERASNLGSGATTVRSPMPGRVVSVLVAEGDSVSEGQGVVIVEAMKMENELRAEIDGIVEKIHVQADDRVDGNADLISLAAAEDAGA